MLYNIAILYSIWLRWLCAYMFHLHCFLPLKSMFSKRCVHTGDVQCAHNATHNIGTPLRQTWRQTNRSMWISNRIDINMRRDKEEGMEMRTRRRSSQVIWKENSFSANKSAQVNSCTHLYGKVCANSTRIYDWFLYLSLPPIAPSMLVHSSNLNCKQVLTAYWGGCGGAH